PVRFLLPALLHRTALGGVPALRQQLVPAGDRDDWPHSCNKCSRAHPLAEELGFSSGDPEHEKFLVLHVLLPYHFSQKTATGKYLPYFGKPGERGDQKEDPAPRGEHIADRCSTPLNDHPTGRAAVERVLQPVIDPLVRLCREVRGVEEDKIEPAPEAGEEIGSHCIQSFLPCAECRMGVDICYHDIARLYECRGNPTGAGADLQYPVPGTHISQCRFQEQKRVCLGRIYLRRIVGHDRKCRVAGEKGIAPARCTVQTNIRWRGERKIKWTGSK